jgi:hypothetical protein
MLAIGSPGTIAGWHVSLLVSLLGSGWLVSTLLLPGLVVDLFGFGGWLLLTLLAVPAFAVGSLWSLGYLLYALRGNSQASNTDSRPGQVRIRDLC